MRKCGRKVEIKCIHSNNNNNNNRTQGFICLTPQQMRKALSAQGFI